MTKHLPQLLQFLQLTLLIYPTQGAYFAELHPLGEEEGDLNLQKDLANGEYRTHQILYDLHRSSFELEEVTSVLTCWIGL